MDSTIYTESFSLVWFDGDALTCHIPGKLQKIIEFLKRTRPSFATALKLRGGSGFFDSYNVRTGIHRAAKRL
jgi:hypothetical protein